MSDSELKGARFGKERCPSCKIAKATITVAFAVDSVMVSERKLCPKCFIIALDNFQEIPKNA